MFSQTQIIILFFCDYFNFLLWLLYILYCMCKNTRSVFLLYLFLFIYFLLKDNSRAFLIQ